MSDQIYRRVIAKVPEGEGIHHIPECIAFYHEAVKGEGPVLLLDYVTTDEAPKEAVAVIKQKSDKSFEVEKAAPVDFKDPPHDYAGWPKVSEASAIEIKEPK